MIYFWVDLLVGGGVEAGREDLLHFLKVAAHKINALKCKCTGRSIFGF